MRFHLEKQGTIGECREALNEAIAALPLPHTAEHAVVRAAAAYVVEENIDALHRPWSDEHNRARGANISAANLPAEPRTKFSINIEIDVEEVARRA